MKLIPEKICFYVACVRLKRDLPLLRILTPLEMRGPPLVVEDLRYVGNKGCAPKWLKRWLLFQLRGLDYLGKKTPGSLSKDLAYAYIFRRLGIHEGAGVDYTGPGEAEFLWAARYHVSERFRQLGVTIRSKGLVTEDNAGVWTWDDGCAAFNDWAWQLEGDGAEGFPVPGQLNRWPHAPPRRFLRQYAELGTTPPQWIADGTHHIASSMAAAAAATASGSANPAAVPALPSVTDAELLEDDEELDDDEDAMDEDEDDVEDRMEE